MPQLPLRLVPPLGEALPGTPAGAVVSGATLSGPRPAAGPRAATLDRLRALVGSRGRVGILPPPREPDPGLPALDPGSISTDIAGLDAWLHGWPRPGPIEIAGRSGAGRLALVVPLLERLTREGRTVLLVDPLQQLHPPGLGRVDPARIVLVRPPPERAAWTAEQVARSGAVEAMVLLDAPPLGRAGVRLARAAEAGNMAVFVLADRPEVDLPAILRLEADGWQGDEHVRVHCTRSRDGRRVGTRLVAPGERPSEPVRMSEATKAVRYRVRSA